MGSLMMPTRRVFTLCLFIGCILSVLFHAESEASAQSSSFGVFDATADWGLEPEFPPRQGDYKVPGKVEVTGEGENAVYDIYGNGISMSPEDNGFFVYTALSGSQTFSGKLEWIDRGGKGLGSQWASVGFMIREEPNRADSKHYSILYQAGIDEHKMGWRSCSIWRDFILNNRHFYVFHDADNRYVANPGGGMFFRITRFAPSQTFVSEWSKNGVDWIFSHSHKIVMEDTLAYGLMIQNHKDNQLLAHARVSDLRISTPGAMAIRTFNRERYAPASDIKVILEIINPFNIEKQLLIMETLPKRWRAGAISQGGKEEKGTISWTFPTKPGSSYLDYTAISPETGSGDVRFSGMVDGNASAGQNHLLFSRFNVREMRLHSIVQTTYVSVAIVLTIVHLLLFFFYPAMKENLYYSLFAVCYAISVFLYYQNGIISAFPVTSYMVWSDIAWILMYAFMLRFFYQIQGTRLKIYHLSMLLFPLIIGIPILFPLVNLFVGYAIFYTLMLVISFECVRVLIQALRKKIDGIWILGIGALLTVFDIVYLILRLFLGLVLEIIPYDITQERYTAANLYTAFIPLFISMSIYLAYRFAKSNKDLLNLNIELEDRVEQRTQELNTMNVELQEANAQLIQLDQMKSQFVSQASHDLRTPLTAIKGSLDNLLMGIAGEMNEKQQKIMTRATKSVDRLTNLINDVLDLNRIETGRIVLEKTDIPFKALVDNIINENRPAAEQKQIQLAFNADEGDYTLHIDDSKIERVVGELVSNAIKYTPENGTVNVNLYQSVGLASLDPPYGSKQEGEAPPEPLDRRSSPPLPLEAGRGEGEFSTTSKSITLTVQDSGIGMTPEESAKIWDRFYRTSASKKFAKGSGLGLSIAKELAELHEGKLEVESEAGSGTKFTLQLPS